MRVVKEAEERKNEILDVAEHLFTTKGYDHTSTNDILNEIGIARGTLYYHFKSKEDILDAIIERITRQLMAKAKSIIDKKEIPMLQRLTMTIMSLNVEDEIGHEVLEQVHKAQNALMHQKMREELLAGINPLITQLIEEGTKQGVCHTEYPAEAVEMVMLYSYVAFDALEERSETERQKKIAAFIYHMERILGMTQGSLLEVILPLFKEN